MTRPNAHRRGYDHAWRTLRDSFLAEWIAEHGYLCVGYRRWRHRVGILLVDHVVPLAAGGARLDRSNLQVLCYSCHALKTRAERVSTSSVPSMAALRVAAGGGPPCLSQPPTAGGGVLLPLLGRPVSGSVGPGRGSTDSLKEVD